MAEHKGFNDNNSTIGAQNGPNVGAAAHFATINGDGTNLNKSVIVGSDTAKDGAAASVGQKGKLNDSVVIMGGKSPKRPSNEQ